MAFISVATGKQELTTPRSRVADLHVRNMNKAAKPASVAPKGTVPRGSGTTK